MDAIPNRCNIKTGYSRIRDWWRDKMVAILQTTKIQTHFCEWNSVYWSTKHFTWFNIARMIDHTVIEVNLAKYKSHPKKVMSCYVCSNIWGIDGTNRYRLYYTDGKVHRAHMGPAWGRQDTCGPHVGHGTLVSGLFSRITLRILFLCFDLNLSHHFSYVLSVPVKT